MSDMLNTAISGLMAFQQELDTTSNNISNANTAGYSRETTDLVSVPGPMKGSRATSVKAASEPRAPHASRMQVRISRLMGNRVVGIKGLYLRMFIMWRSN